MGDLHEFMMLSFHDGVEDAEQLQTMWALDKHLAACEGLLSREFFRGGDGRWVEHVVWADHAGLEASTHLDDDPAIAALFDRIDAHTVTYTCGERIEPEQISVP